MMTNFLTMLASAGTEAEAQAGILGALGIEWKTLILQVIAFLIFVGLLAKFVFPILVRAIDKREKAIADSVAAANEAEAKAEQTQAEIEKLFAEARKDAAELVDAAHKESAQMVKEAEDKAKTRQEQIVADGKAQIAVATAKARDVLRKEAVSLVAEATGTIIGEKVDSAKDAELISRALKDATKDTAAEAR